MNFLYTFILLNVANVIIQTVKSLATVKCGKVVASLVNAVAYSLYTYVVVFMNADGLELWQKALIIGLCNLVGVFVVKLIEEKSRKDRLWCVRFTVKGEDVAQSVDRLLDKRDIPHSFFSAGKHTVFDCYCATQGDTLAVKDVIEHYEGKYFVSESKAL